MTLRYTLVIASRDPNNEEKEPRDPNNEEKEPLRTLWERYTLVYMPPMYPGMYTPWYTPYLHTLGTPLHPAHQATVQAPRHREGSLTALERAVTELFVTDERVTVLRRELPLFSTDTRFTVGCTSHHPGAIP